MTKHDGPSPRSLTALRIRGVQTDLNVLRNEPKTKTLTKQAADFEARPFNALVMRLNIMKELIDGKADKNWRKKVEMLPKSKIIDLLEMKIKKSERNRKGYEKYKKQYEEVYDTLYDPERCGEFLAGL